MSARPLLTFGLVAYNQSAFIREAVRGALSQTYDNLEVILSDDGSSDDTYELMKDEVARSQWPHHVTLSRNERNHGFGAHLNRMMELARGELLVIAAGDDVSLPQRTERVYDTYMASSGRAMAMYSNAIVLDECGRREGVHLARPSPESLTMDWFATHRAGTLGCTQAWHRRTFESFGPLGEDVLFEDHVIPFRAALLGEVHYIDEALVLYRRHANNMHFREAVNFTPSQVNAHLLKYVDANIATCRQRMRDVEQLSRLQPDRAAECRGYQRETERLLQEALDEKQLSLNTDVASRLIVMWRAAMRGIPPRRLARWVLTYFFPNVYLRYHVRARGRTREVLTTKQAQ